MPFKDGLLVGFLASGRRVTASTSANPTELRVLQTSTISADDFPTPSSTASAASSTSISSGFKWTALQISVLNLLSKMPIASGFVNVFGNKSNNDKDDDDDNDNDHVVDRMLIAQIFIL